MSSRSLEREAEAFDRHARERVEHGQIPDLRRAVPCDYFYNNIWRRPYLLDAECGRNFRFAAAHLRPGRILEVGSGPGHMSLELARAGFLVTGLELSGVAVDIARRFALENPVLSGFGSLEYVQADFLDWQPGDRYDGVCFFNTLHHFNAVDRVLQRVEEILSPEGRLVVVEPARDWLGEREAAVAALIRWLLAAHGAWYQPIDLPASLLALEDGVDACLREYREARDAGEPAQSPHDNAVYGDDMLAALRRRFEEIAWTPGASIFYKLGGGIRGGTEEQVRRTADLLHAFDRYAVQRGLLKAGEFLWAGRVRG
jgi:2-polyprenyl-3-methyl-5-hydroxy-6-metoxy-1,4-benzoquinol methylase